MHRFFSSAISFGVLAIVAFPIQASSFILKSEQFQDGDTLPNSMVYKGFGCNGDNIAPKLSWQNPPVGTKSYAVTVFDPDAPTGVGWWHWTVFNIPGDATGLSANTSGSAQDLPLGSVEGYTDFGSSGYGGACPPIGDKPHEYIFTVYALNVASIPADQTTTGAKLAFLIKNHVLSKATISAEYQR
jgi:Raf kinase inhibitor-like YbhB/YbcL family protein